MANQPAAQTDRIVAFVTWVVANPIPSLTILAAASYLVFRTAFLIYYNRFGVTPEEVGLDYLGILSTQAAGGVAEVLLVVGIALVAKMRIARIKMKIEDLHSRVNTALISSKDQTGIQQTQESVAEGVPTTQTSIEAKVEEVDVDAYFESLRNEARRQSRWAAAALIGIPLAFFFLVVRDAAVAGDGARIPSITSPLQARAIPVAALWIDPPGGAGKPRPIEYADLGVDDQQGSLPGFLLLGGKDNALVLYDKRLGAVRLPRDNVLLVSSSTQ